jgi:hypothetical protein
MDEYDEIVPCSDELPPVAMDRVRDQHVERLRPRYWLGAARSLRYSADIIFEHERPYAQILDAVALGSLDRSHLKQWPNHAGAHLLYAFAFENLLKGIIIAKTPGVLDSAIWGITEDEDRPLRKLRVERGYESWITHDVKKLLELAGIEIPEPYRRLLWLFEGKAVWSGRYPTASSAPKGVRLYDDQIPDFVQHPDPSNQVLVGELFRMLESELARLIPTE